MTDPCYTAAQIAAALNVSKDAIKKRLAGVPVSGWADANGQRAKAWVVDHLPQAIRDELAAVARDRGCPVERLLATPEITPWQPPLPWNEIAPRFRVEAEKRRDALAPVLANAAPTMPRKEKLDWADRNYRKIFGHPLQEAGIDYLLNRAVERDNSFGQWQRPELYLDEDAFKDTPAKPIVLSWHVAHNNALGEIIEHLENRSNPTPEDRAEVFHAAFLHLEAMLAQHPEAEKRDIKASLMQYVYGALPGLSKGKKSFQRLFQLLLKNWRDGSRTRDAITDRRRLQSGNFRRPNFTEDVRKIRDLAIQLDGNESQAYRRLRQQEGQLSPDFCEYYEKFDPRRAKSYVPHVLRQAITPEVNMCLPLRHGPWAAKMAGPYITRDWSDVQPGDYFSGDDVTWNHYFRYQDEQGQTRITRGECLILTDLRTGYPLDFILIAGKYNSEHIRGLILRVHDGLGLPYKGFYFEQGVWKARMIPGEHRRGAQWMHWRDTEGGFEKEGLFLERRHATTPRAKPIECLIRIFQERMRCLPGFVGFNERTDERERVQELIQRAGRGDAQALVQFPTEAAWRDQIRAVLEEFKNDPQNGVMLPGVSPAEAWQAGLRSRPLRQLSENARYLLATHRQQVTVRQEGIVLTIRGQKMPFYGEHTGARIGQEVLAFYNIEKPDLLTISDLDRTAYFTVKRAPQLPAMTASKNDFAAIHEQISAHRAPAKAIYGNLKHDLVATVSRDTEYDETTLELGQFHNEAVEQDRAQEELRRTKLKHIPKIVSLHGVPESSRPVNADKFFKRSNLGLERSAR